MSGRRYSFFSALLAAVASVSVVAQETNTPLVSYTDTWHCRKGTNAPQTDWQSISNNALDASWFTGIGGFGYATNSTAYETSLVHTALSDMRYNYTTFYCRRAFDVTNAIDTGGVTNHIYLSMDWDDGYVAYLDGVEVCRANAPGTPGTEPPYTAVSAGSHESSRGNNNPKPAEINDLGEVGSRLDIGAHVLAVMALNDSADSSDCIIIPDLYYAPFLVNTNSYLLTNDTTWHAADSPIILKGMITNAATLTIEPGTTVRFESQAGIQVTAQGRILAEGTPSNRILFSSAPATARWRGITIAGGAGSPETRIAYANIESNNNTAVHSTGGALFLDHLVFGTTDRQYLSLDGSSFIVSECVFPTTTAALEPVHGAGGIRSGGRGIFLRCFFGMSSGYTDIVDFTGGNRPDEAIVQFIDNVFIGSTDDILDLDGTDAWIEGNIFLHAHKNGSPDSSSAVSGGGDSGRTSEITIIGNIFFDCDQAVTAKEGNFYTLVNNTIVLQTHEGGLDTNGAVVNLADDGTVEGAGCYLEGNIIYDAEALTRGMTAAAVTFTNNSMNLEWTGPGGGNSTNDPMLKHIPLPAEAAFTNWADAQIMRDWFSLLPGSPAIGAGPEDHDRGGIIPLGAFVSGEPDSTTTQTWAGLVVGVNRYGNGIPASGWPDGSGYTHYKWRLDTNAWSAETPIATPITLAGLPLGTHRVEVTGKRDSQYYQDDPAFGVDAIITTSRTWTITTGDPPQPHIASVSCSNDTFSLTFDAEAGNTYSVQFSDWLLPTNWIKLASTDADITNRMVKITDPDIANATNRFYRVVTPALP